MYARPDSVDAALALLHQHGDDARILAGGQSLVPMLSMRLAQPDVVIDINRIAELEEIGVDDQGVTIGALTRYARVEHDQDLAARIPLLAAAMPLIAHSGVRNRGTLGGSVSLADPAAELPACCLCLDARMTLRSHSRGERDVDASEFFQGVYTTIAEPDEMLMSLRIPSAPGRRYAIREVAPRHGDFALAGLCASADVRDDHFHDVRMVFFGFGSGSTVADHAASVLVGANVADKSARLDAITALDRDLELEDEEQISAAVRGAMVRTLTLRVLSDLEADDE